MDDHLRNIREKNVLCCSGYFERKKTTDYIKNREDKLEFESVNLKNREDTRTSTFANNLNNLADSLSEFQAYMMHGLFFKIG